MKLPRCIEIRAYIVSKLNKDFRHSDEGFIEVLHSTRGLFWSFETHIPYSPLWEELGICDRVVLGEVDFEVFICHGRRKSANKYPRSHCSKLLKCTSGLISHDGMNKVFEI